VLRLLGYDHVRNYDGSMREWANREDTALVV
jgi:3-mercaptopyruvate sulfurtransferase SseA